MPRKQLLMKNSIRRLGRPLRLRIPRTNNYSPLTVNPLKFGVLAFVVFVCVSIASRDATEEYVEHTDADLLRVSG
jgi:hypothetical protein